MLRILSIRTKLIMGLGILVLLTMLVAWLGVAASNEAQTTMNRITERRVPSALVAARAQKHLLMMLSAVQGYLILGEDWFVIRYTNAEQAFEEDIQQLDTLSQDLQPRDQDLLVQFDAAYQEWANYPQTLFALRDDQMQREPAFRWLNTTGAESGGIILMKLDKMIDMQAEQAPTTINMHLLRDMARFQSSFSSMLAGLRSYVTTRDDTFRYYEYDNNLLINDEVWEKLLDQKTTMTPEQQALMESIAEHRKTFIASVPTHVFVVMESDRWREDRYIFKTKAEPLAEVMQQTLLHFTESQQQALVRDMQQSQQALVYTQWQKVAGSIAAIVLGIALAFLIVQSIVQPIRRLKAIAEQIQSGNLAVEAPIESRDEIGTFAQTFNRMTSQLRSANYEKEQLIAARADAVYTFVQNLNNTIYTLFAMFDSLLNDMQEAGIPEENLANGKKEVIIALEQQRALLRTIQETLLLKTDPLSKKTDTLSLQEPP